MSAIGAVILAAGMSVRMGRHKTLMPFLGKPLFQHAVEAAIFAQLQPIVLIGGYRIGELIEQAKTFHNIEIIENTNYRSGMASSLAAGIGAITGRTDAAFVLLADQPLVSPSAIAAMKREYLRLRGEGVRILRAEYGGTPGHPVLFDAGLYEELRRIEGDEGGKSVIAGHRSLMRSVAFDRPEWGADVDTPADLRKLEQAARRGPLFD